MLATHISERDLPRLYKAVDAFVLPSRGEGWGRPIVEAMARVAPHFSHSHRLSELRLAFRLRRQQIVIVCCALALPQAMGLPTVATNWSAQTECAPTAAASHTCGTCPNTAIGLIISLWTKP